MPDEQVADLKEALAQVRAAYRLIHAYQRRILDLLAVLDEQLAKHGMVFDEWRTPYYNPPVRSDTKPFHGKWAWDLLPGYSLWCTWENADKAKRWRRIYVHVATDSSFEDFKKTVHGEPMAENMLPVEKTSSALWISLYSSETGGMDVKQAWLEASKLGDQLYDGKTHLFGQGAKPFRYSFCELSLADLPDETMVTEKLIRPLEEWVKSGDFAQPR